MKEKSKGITLIALVITIIVMLILVAVTINMAINGGLFGHAGKAVGDMQNAMNAEQQLANGQITIDGKTYASIDDYLNRLELGKGNWYYCVDANNKAKSNEATFYVSNGEMIIPVGSKVSYTEKGGKYKIDTSKGIGTFVEEDTNGEIRLIGNGTEIETVDLGYWLILGVSDDGLLELVSTYTSASDNVKNKEKIGNEYGWLVFYGQDGYTNEPQLLNDICGALYGNGTGAISARSINIEDIKKLTRFDKKDCSISWNDNNNNVGKKWTYKIVEQGGENKIYVFEEGLTRPSDVEKIEENGKTWYYTGESSFTYYDEADKTWKTLGKSKDKNGNVIKEVTIVDTWFVFDMSKAMEKTEPLYVELFENSIICLPGQSVACSWGGCLYGTQCLVDDHLRGIGDSIIIFESNGKNGFSLGGFRPIVTLSSNVTLTYDTTHEGYKINGTEWIETE